jgi:predicted enzyme related to lactoylglutathione lyase
MLSNVGGKESFEAAFSSPEKDIDKMATSILGLRTTIYKVGDMAEGKAWYSKAFEVEPYFEAEPYIGFNVAGYELGLMKDEAPAAPKTANVLTYWGVNDIDEAMKSFIALGATKDEAPMNVGGDIVTALVKDPWGYIIGLIYNPEFTLE